MATVRAVRGATTVSGNEAANIIEGTARLLLQMAEENGIGENDIISVIFTVTGDLDAAFPAEAARRIGWMNTPLMCMTEIPVPGSLQKCVRVLMHINTEKEKAGIRHVYLEGAKVLRPDLADRE